MRTSLRPLRRAAVLVAAALLVVAVSVGFAACGSGDDASTASSGTGAATTASGPKVVASTGWVAAIAKLAGAGEVTIIAPSSVQHPPDYEPKPSDLQAVADADYVLLAGFEGFAGALKKAAGGDAEVVTVGTTYDPAKLAAEIRKLGTTFGTTEVAEANAARVQADLEAVCSDVQEQVSGAKPVVVSHLFVTDWAACAGLTPAGTFGPAPITPGEVTKLAAKKPAIVFENLHMAGSGEAVAGATGAEMIELVNFPDDGDLDLIAVARKNADTMVAALTQ